MADQMALQAQKFVNATYGSRTGMTWRHPGQVRKGLAESNLADLEGVVRWGGDDKKPDEALFSIDVKPGNGHLLKVADKLRGWAATPGEGAGASTDPFEPVRRRAAERLARLQA